MSSNPHALIIRGDYSALEKYLSDGGDPNAKGSEWPNNSLLMSAVMEGNLEIISLLLDHINKKNLNPNLKCGDGKTPLEIINYKLEKGDKSAKIMSTLLNQAIELYKSKKLKTFQYAHERRGFPDMDKTINETIAFHVRNQEGKKKKGKSRRHKSRRWKSRSHKAKK